MSPTAGTVPIILSLGAGTDTPMVISVVVLSGVLSATIFTLFVVPVTYSLLARRSALPTKRNTLTTNSKCYHYAPFFLPSVIKSK